MGVACAAILSEVEKRSARGIGESRRLFHGRGGTFPGLESIAVDWHPPVVLITLYSDLLEGELTALVKGLLATLGSSAEAAALQRRYLEDTPTEILHGKIPAEHFAREGGLRYRLRIGDAQNIGFFLDMGEGRKLIRDEAKGKKVLNLFAYTCSFSVAALKGGAKEVVNLDMNRGALQLGRENHLVNEIDLRNASFLNHDLFKSFGKVKRLGPFDLVIIDPPTAQGLSFTAERDWVKVIKRIPDFTTRGSRVLACLNAPHLASTFITDLVDEHLPGAILLKKFGSGDDFPEADFERGLKLLYYEL